MQDYHLHPSFFFDNDDIDSNIDNENTIKYIEEKPKQEQYDAIEELLKKKQHETEDLYIVVNADTDFSEKITVTQEPKESINPNLVECKTCKREIARTANSCPHCGVSNPGINVQESTKGCLQIFSFFFIILFGIFLWVFITAKPIKTNQQILNEYHAKGEFLGYQDGEKWAKDVIELHEATEILKNRHQ